MRVLVTGAQGDIAEAICRILVESYPGISVHGSDLSDDDWPTLAGFATVHSLPRGDSLEYTKALADLQCSEHFDIIIPLSEAELGNLAEDRMDLPVLMLAPSLVRAFLDKQTTDDWLREHGLPSARTRPLEECSAANLPLFVKPRYGHGSKGARPVTSEAELALAQAERGEPLVAQEFLDDPAAEFTCAVFRRAERGQTRTLSLRRRLVGGLTGRAIVEDRPELNEMLLRFAEAADLDGSINVQLRLTNAGPVIFEVNPRFSSTVMMRHRIGFRDVVWAVDTFFKRGAIPPFRPPVGTRFFRLGRELVVPPRVERARASGEGE